MYDRSIPDSLSPRCVRFRSLQIWRRKSGDMLRTQQREMMSLTFWRRRGSAYNNRCRLSLMWIINNCVSCWKQKYENPQHPLKAWLFASLFFSAGIWAEQSPPDGKRTAADYGPARRRTGSAQTALLCFGQRVQVGECQGSGGGSPADWTGPQTRQGTNTLKQTQSPHFCEVIAAVKLFFVSHRRRRPARPWEWSWRMRGGERWGWRRAWRSSWPNLTQRESSSAPVWRRRKLTVVS